ncbi:MAG: transcription termination/antitermination protein NusG [Mucinivorans sp.]
MSGQQEMQWYVLRAIGGKEKKVKEYLEAEVRTLKLQDFISQILIPTEKVYAVRAGKKVLKERVSFPGYILVQCHFVGEIPHILRNIPNVMGFLCDEKGSMMDATPLRDVEVARLLGQVDAMAESEEQLLEVGYVVGDAVRVIDGPFASFVGVVETVDEQRKKLTVSVKIFGRKTPMELSYTQVEKE